MDCLSILIPVKHVEKRKTNIATVNIYVHANMYMQIIYMMFCHCLSFDIIYVPLGITITCISIQNYRLSY